MRMGYWGRGIGAFVLVGLLAPAALAGSPNVAKGRQLFVADCADCHLQTGAGGVHFGHAVSADLRAPGLEHVYRGSDALILRAILAAKDQNGKRLDAPMPAWRGRLSKAQAGAIVAYLRTLHS